MTYVPYFTCPYCGHSKEAEGFGQDMFFVPCTCTEALNKVRKDRESTNRVTRRRKDRKK